MARTTHHRISLTTDDLEYLCEVLQSDINKGDLGALHLWHEFQAVLLGESVDK